MTYLQDSEYAQYGLDAATPASLVAAASALIEQHCRRPSLAVQQYTERLRITAGRNSIGLSFLPLAPLAPATSPLVSARARYAMPRRGEGGSFRVNAAATEIAYDVAQAFALPGSWTMLDVATLDVFADTGELTFPMNVLGLPYNEVEITYTAGLDPVADAVKFACAQIVRNAQATPALNVRASNVERMHMEYFSDSLLDATVRQLLAPYVAQKVA
jgi:hypothetical protein